MLARFTGANIEIHSQHQRFSVGRHQQAAHHFEGRGFAGAVRAKQAENLTALNEIDVVGGGEITKLFVNDRASMTVSSLLPST